MEMLFLSKSQLLDFEDKVKGARCWGKSLLDQRSRERTLLSFLPPLGTRRTRKKETVLLKSNMKRISWEIPPWVKVKLAKVSLMWWSCLCLKCPTDHRAVLWELDHFNQ